jgi:cellulose synthase/poly-beta-1,6-N-acetylglucosamine synthase-like glycosyltransferase
VLKATPASLQDLPWEYVAVFDADFEMPRDFLFQTVWHMAEDPRLAFVQTRWTFTNGYDNLLCWCAAAERDFILIFVYFLGLLSESLVFLMCKQLLCYH